MGWKASKACIIRVPNVSIHSRMDGVYDLPAKRSYADAGSLE